MNSVSLQASSLEDAASSPVTPSHAAASHSGPSSTLQDAFAVLGVAPPLCHALKAQGYSVPTAIQVRAIPLLLQGRDLLGLAQTGTGKTAAFALPILQQLAEQPAPEKRHPRALILAPTRELAVQIGESFAAYGARLDLRHTVVLGGVSPSAQARALAKGVDIVVATPGRLLDLARQRHARLDRITHFVLDEADRMLDMGFIRDVQKIVALLPRQRQSLLFSATMPKDVEHLAASLLRDPARVEVAPQSTTVERIEQRVHFVPTADKRKFLLSLLEDRAMSRVLVFTRTKHHANRVSDFLDIAEIPADAIHGNKSQNARQRALENFRSGKSRVLVATDIAARGIDVDGVTHVVNFELPNEPESYVHRIGRTGRAGASGIAISLCDASERGFLRDIERVTRQKLTAVGEYPAESSHASPIRMGRRGHAKAEVAGTDPNAKYKRRRRWRGGYRKGSGQAA